MSADADSHGTKPIRVLEKAWAVLDEFSSGYPELTLKQLRERCGFPATTMARLVENLLNHGLLDRHGDRYRIGLRVLTWSESARRNLDVAALLGPVIEDLRDVTGESAALYQCRGMQRVCVAVAETRHAVIWQLQIGLTTPLHIGSGGRAMLAFDQKLYKAVRFQLLESSTKQTLGDLEQLDRALAETRRTGAAISIENLTTGVAGVSSPVIGEAGNVIASLGVAGPVQRFRPQDIRRYVPAVVAAGRKASAIMGGEFPVATTS